MGTQNATSLSPLAETMIGEAVRPTRLIRNVYYNTDMYKQGFTMFLSLKPRKKS